MKKFALLIPIVILAVAASMISGCSMVSPLPSVVYNGTKGGLAVNNGVVAEKTGSACAQNLFYVASWGDASIEAAKKAGMITEVASVDFETFSVLVYGKYCTIVKGK